MGIINCTPDSYFDGGSYDPIVQGQKLIQEGADLLDIGGESTRPGFTPVSIEEELRRVIPVVKALNGYTLSIDTSKPEVAIQAFENGASILNDVTGFENPQMREIARGKKVILMHCRKEENLIPGMLSFFEKRAKELDGSEIILDPGIGFGKTVDQNYLILKNLKSFTELGFPLLMGLSRKSFIQKVLNRTAAEILPATLALNTLSLIEGVDYIRVHDVREHRQILTVLERLQSVS